MDNQPDFYTPTGKPSKVRHGTDAAYVSFRCRCRPCKDAHKEVEAKARRRKGIKPRGVLMHGTHGMYTVGKCRCTPCTEANKLNMREYRSRVRAAKELL